MIGSALSTAANGTETSDNMAMRDAAIARSTAASAPASRPINAFRPVVRAADQTLARSCTSSAQIADGAGNTNGAIRPTRTVTSQPRIAAIPTTTGGSTDRVNLTPAPAL